MFEIGNTYTRAEVQERIGAPISSGGDWGTGYAEFGGRAWIFCNIGSAGRTGADYDNYWSGDRLIWRGKPHTKRGQPQVERILSGKAPVEIFFRTGDRNPFIYAGEGTALSASGEKPITVEWALPKGRPPAPLTAGEIAAGLTDLGFQVGPIGSKSQRAERDGLVLYIKRDTKLTPLVLHPKWQDHIFDLEQIPGVWRAKGDFFYHQSMLTDFPKRLHTGKTPTHYGLDIEVNSRQALRELTVFMSEWRQRPSASLPTDKSEPSDAMDVDPRTETEAVRAARLGQGKYRNDLLALWQGRCALTSLAMPEAIRASHIKPWRLSSPQERLDPKNGLPLLVHIDYLFDRGLISFDEAGDILLSPKLDAQKLQTFGLTSDMRINGLTVETKHFLLFHRTEIFIDE